MNRLTAAVLFSVLAVPAWAQDVTEPKTGTKFASNADGMSLLGVGLRTKTMMKVKVYAIALYVADSALAGPLKGKAGTGDLYREIVDGNFKKRIVLKFVRDLSTDQIRDAFHESMKGAGSKADVWIGYFNSVVSGQEAVITWTPGVGLETKVAGLNKTPIDDKALASAVFAIWLGEKPIQEDLKKDLVMHAGVLIK
jgi:chalcone isomerase-like protein